MKIYSGPLSMFGAKAEIAAHEKGIAFELEMVAFSQEKGYAPKHPEVLRINPKRQVPVLIDGALEIFDSTQIFEYFEDRFPSPPLWPRDPADRARARQLEHKSDEVFFPHVIRLMGLGGDRARPEWIQARDGLTTYYDLMERQLADRDYDYLAGPYTYADIAFFMAQFFAARHAVPMTAAHPRLRAWRLRVAQRPAVARVYDAMCAYLRSIGYPVPDYA
jgi:glutathione S-transferase